MKLTWRIVIALLLAGAIFGTWDMFQFSEARFNESGFLTMNGTVVLDPQKWPGQPFLLAKYIDSGQILLNGDWTVVLYRSDCEHCQRILPMYADRARTSDSKKRIKSIAFIEMPPYSDHPIGPQLAGSDILCGRVIASHDWFVPTPVVLSVENGIVRKVAEADAADDLSSFIP